MEQEKSSTIWGSHGGEYEDGCLLGCSACSLVEGATTQKTAIFEEKSRVQEFKIQSVLKVALPKYLVVIIKRCQMCTEHAGQQFEQFL
jgi:hypothetical protein